MRFWGKISFQEIDLHLTQRLILPHPLAQAWCVHRGVHNFQNRLFAKKRQVLRPKQRLCEMCNNFQPHVSFPVLVNPVSHPPPCASAHSNFPPHLNPRPLSRSCAYVSPVPLSLYSDAPPLYYPRGETHHRKRGGGNLHFLTT